MQFIEKYESLDKLLERIDMLKREENYFEEDFHILGLADLEPDWTDYMGSTYHPHSDHVTFKDFFTKNIKAKDYLHGSGLEESLVQTHLSTLEEEQFILAFDNDALDRDMNRESMEANIEKGPGDNL